jgi:hypothetical protein
MTQNTVHHGGQPVVTGKDLRTGFEELGLPSAPAGLLISSGCCRVLIPAVGRSYAVHAGRRVDRRAATVS